MQVPSEPFNSLNLNYATGDVLLRKDRRARFDFGIFGMSLKTAAKINKELSPVSAIRSETTYHKTKLALILNQSCRVAITL